MPVWNEPFVCPSILSADFAKLGEEIEKLDRGGADYIHVDVMDGHFVPNLTIGPPVVGSIRKITAGFLDCHLMIEKPERYIEAFAKEGADGITVHVEACPHLHRVLQQIREMQSTKKRPILAGVSLNPHTPLSSMLEVLPLCDLVLLMTVNPGFGGQKYIASVETKIAQLRAEITRLGLPTRIQVDGGVSETNVEKPAYAGADTFVAGTAVFKNERFPGDYGGAIAAIRANARAAMQRSPH
jgi:ribulose-phosphate 3-epimerase